MASSLDTPQTPKRQKRQAEKSQRDFVAMLNLGSIAIQGAGLFFLLLLLVAFWRLSSRPVPTLVQMSDGTAINVQAMGSLERSPELIQRFTTDSLSLLMGWQQKIPSAEVAADGSAVLVDDPGIEVQSSGGRKFVTTRAFQSSFTFADNFRSDLLSTIGSMTNEQVFTGQVQTALVFQAVTKPEVIKPGEWRITIIASLVQSNVGAGTTDSIPFNKELVLRAVDTPALPADGKFASPLESAVHAVRQAGLEIVSMKDIDPSGGTQP